MSPSIFRTLVFMSVLLAGAVVAFAQDLDSVRAQMRERLPQVDALKASGAIGEDNRGFLAVRDGGGNAAEIVAAENADRRVVYEAIAEQTGSTPEAVGRTRAKKIATQSAAGVWLEAPDGEWYKK